MKYSYKVHSSGGTNGFPIDWKIPRKYPITKKQAEQCVLQEHRPAKVITWHDALKMMGIEPAK